MEVTWTQTALNQFRKAVSRSREEFGDIVAENFRLKALETVRPLKDHPQMGHPEPLLKDKKFEYRYLLFKRYKILYRLTKEKIYIIRFFHTSQNPNKLIF